jgi:hypothetical protein
MDARLVNDMLIAIPLLPPLERYDVASPRGCTICCVLIVAIKERSSLLDKYSLVSEGESPVTIGIST